MTLFHPHTLRPWHLLTLLATVLPVTGAPTAAAQDPQVRPSQTVTIATTPAERRAAREEHEATLRAMLTAPPRDGRPKAELVIRSAEVDYMVKDEIVWYDLGHSQTSRTPRLRLEVELHNNTGDTLRPLSDSKSPNYCNTSLAYEIEGHTVRIDSAMICGYTPIQVALPYDFCPMTLVFPLLPEGVFTADNYIEKIRPVLTSMRLTMPCRTSDGRNVEAGIRPFRPKRIALFDADPAPNPYIDYPHMLAKNTLINYSPTMAVHQRPTHDSKAVAADADSVVHFGPFAVPCRQLAFQGIRFSPDGRWLYGNLRWIEVYTYPVICRGWIEWTGHVGGSIRLSYPAWEPATADPATADRLDSQRKYIRRVPLYNNDRDL